ncbi:ricin B lectin domain-containing protein [Gilbertella persicaria]|uniref:ricin B lectin domain-containing protein n=1 Tax=Gilbertella persicaria TaxID=101096 RepID=UPI00221E4383|nr:ricin B lectin domain-containing protein [Gilbertella persicaria]KAI8078052.1 ricin B lectin domain-containing protein [Gilbertella persicaria]
MFPQGHFYILSRKHGFALDVYDGQTKEDANIIVWPQKFQDSDNQLWSFDHGRLINKKSGHALDISSSAFRKDKIIVQKKMKANKQSQEWIYDQGFICSKEYPSLVLDIRGDSAKGGAQVLLYKRKDTDNLNQLWQFEPYQQFEGALNLAATSLPLHKKEGFGQPRLGYGAEPGVPPELKQIPEHSKIAGVGNNTVPSSTTNGPGDSRHDPVLAQYGSFYGGTPTSPPPAQPGHAPPLPPKNASAGYHHPPPPPPPSAFPEPIPASSVPNSTYPPPTGYPSSTGGGGYPPSSPSNYPQPGGFSTYPPISPSHSSHDYPHPAYPPSNNNTGYPPPPLSSSSSSGYPPSQPYPPPSLTEGYPPPSSSTEGYPPPSNQHGYPPPPSTEGYPSNQHGYPPPLSNRQEPYGYPPNYQ